MYRFQHRLKILKQHIWSCNKTKFGNIFQAQKYVEQQMKVIHQEIIAQGSLEWLKEAKEHI